MLTSAALRRSGAVEYRAETILVGKYETSNSRWKNIRWIWTAPRQILSSGPPRGVNSASRWNQLHRCFWMSYRGRPLLERKPTPQTQPWTLNIPSCVVSHDQSKKNTSSLQPVVFHLSSPWIETLTKNLSWVRLYNINTPRNEVWKAAHAKNEIETAQ